MTSTLMFFAICFLFVLSVSTIDYSSEEDMDDNEDCYYSAPPVCRRSKSRAYLQPMCDCVQSMHETGTCEYPKIKMFLLSNMSMEIRRTNKKLDFVWNICIKTDFTYDKFFKQALNFAMTSNDPIIPLAVLQIRHSNIDSIEDKKTKVMHYLYDNNKFFKAIYYKLMLGF